MNDPLAAGPGAGIRAPDTIDLRQWALALLAVLLSAILSVAAYRFLSNHSEQVAAAFQAGMFTAAATLLGTLPILFSRHFSQRLQDTMLGFGAGVMLAACSFSLILPAIDASESSGAGPWQAGGLVSFGILAGAALLFAFDRLLPHEHFIKGLDGRHARRLRRTWLFVGAIALHNLPEGLAVGVAFGGPDAVGAKALASGIAIQNIPEGLVVALSLRSVGYGRMYAALLGALSGLLEPLASVLGAALIGLSAGMLPWGLAFAAGAMLYVISNEIIPESHRRGHESFATWGLMFGFVLMMLLDTALG